MKVSRVGPSGHVICGRHVSLVPSFECASAKRFVVSRVLVHLYHTKSLEATIRIRVECHTCTGTGTGVSHCRTKPLGQFSVFG